MNSEIVARLQRTIDEDNRAVALVPGAAGVDSIFQMEKMLATWPKEDSETVRALLRSISNAEAIREDAEEMLARHFAAVAGRMPTSRP